MSDTQLPRWLQELVERRVNASLESPCEWPNGQFPHLAFRAREIVAEDDDGDDGQVSLLQVVIDEAERLQAIVDKLPKCWRLDDSGKLVQDVSVVPGMELFILPTGGGDVFSVDVLGGDCIIRYPDGDTSHATMSRYASTREAAEAVGGAHKPDYSRGNTYYSLIDDGMYDSFLGQ